MAFTIEQVSRKLEAYRGWEYSSGCVRKVYRFESFIRAVEVVNQIALVAEHQQHYPHIEIKVNTVTISFCPEEGVGITQQDLRMVDEIEKLVVAFI
jgi:4a-hydroxytetrahydrobiopterin dehydratase